MTHYNTIINTGLSEEEEEEEEKGKDMPTIEESQVESMAYGQLPTATMTPMTVAFPKKKEEEEKNLKAELAIQLLE